MSRIRNKDMKPEMVVRRLIYALGFRYQLHRNDLPGRPDIVFRGRRKIIFVHGCFWHQHSGCKNAHFPKSNLDYWRPKLENNVSRDQTNINQLKQIGWEILIIWECEISNTSTLKSKITSFLSDFNPPE